MDDSAESVKHDLQTDLSTKKSTNSR